METYKAKGLSSTPFHAKEELVYPSTTQCLSALPPIPHSLLTHNLPPKDIINLKISFCRYVSDEDYIYQPWEVVGHQCGSEAQEQRQLPSQFPPAWHDTPSPQGSHADKTCGSKMLRSVAQYPLFSMWYIAQQPPC